MPHLDGRVSFPQLGLSPLMELGIWAISLPLQMLLSNVPCGALPLLSAAEVPAGMSEMSPQNI